MIYKLNAEVSRYIAYTHEFLITYAGTLFKQASNTILNRIFFFGLSKYYIQYIQILNSDKVLREFSFT